MDQEQEQELELQHLGFIGTHEEAYKTILSRRNFFAHLSAVVVLPLAILLLTYNYASNLLFASIVPNRVKNFIRSSGIGEQIFYDIISTFPLLFLTKFLYLALILIFSTITTTAVAYTVACVHVAKQVSFQKVMSLVPSVFKRLLVTFLPYFLITFGCNIVASLIAILFIFCNLTPELSAASIALLVTLVVVYILGFAYLTIIWHFASIVTVLEGVYGKEAIKRSKNLMRGKLMVAVKTFFIFFLWFIGIEIGFWMLVVSGDGLLGVRIMFLVVMLLALTVLILFGFVAQSVLYFVCKSYHHEKVEKARLFDHLESYFAECEPLKGRDLQIGHYSDLHENV